MPSEYVSTGPNRVGERQRAAQRVAGGTVVSEIDIVSFLLILGWVHCADLKKPSYCFFVEGNCDQVASTKQIEGYHQRLLHSLSK